MLKILAFFLLSSCLPYYFQDSAQCDANPYIYSQTPIEWQAWERVNWASSCSRRQTSSPYYQQYGDGNLDTFGHSNPMIRLY
jgi:hypothetical protein